MTKKPTPTKSTHKERPPSKAQAEIERIIATHGDMLFDLCESILWDPAGVPYVFREILKELGKSLPSEGYKTYERAWVLRVAAEKLQDLSTRFSRVISPSEQIELDGKPETQRIKQFEHYFHRLDVTDRILFLLKDKYGLPLSEISNALGEPEGSLKLRRNQSLRTLEDWLWD